MVNDIAVCLFFVVVVVVVDFLFLFFLQKKNTFFILLQNYRGYKHEKSTKENQMDLRNLHIYSSFLFSWPNRVTKKNQNAIFPKGEQSI